MRERVQVNGESSVGSLGRADSVVVGRCPVWTCRTSAFLNFLKGGVFMVMYLIIAMIVVILLANFMSDKDWWRW